MLGARPKQCLNHTIFSISSPSALIVTTWDLYDSFVGSAHEEQTSTHNLELLDLNDPAVDISKGTDLSFSFSSTASTGSF